ncbi:N-acetylmuramoyl-L-alanine amidase [Rufibacter ruber]|uniref:N-acetylmuramoyl-L-alanine amidase n=1 Tax=Rufibacter ruber TaxID=1783499 RepID=UPI00083280D7|nr:N-acetylmuramoyl-L-alanine amidase [Rufibacter ruber]
MIKLYRSTFFWLLLLCLTRTGLAQENDVQDTLVSVFAGQQYQFPLKNATAIGIKCEDCSLQGAYFLQGADTLWVKTDPHADQSALVSIEKETENIAFFSSTGGSMQFFFIKAGTVKAANRKKTALREGSGDCAFEVVPTSVWRLGLAAPTYTRSFTQTKHVAVHHAAGSNTATDYFREVRNIYLYHRNTNGWSDIGYNYLIAPDGTIFQGRDNPTGSFDNDYVFGAHLCSNNSNAMGICLLGDYTSILPTQKAMESLYKIIKWKTQKDNIDIFGTTEHLIGPSDYGVKQQMPNVLGHRDGCRPGYTSCPGNMLYTKMAEIRSQASSICPLTTGVAELGLDSQAALYPNPAAGTVIKAQFAWSTLAIYTLGGKLVRTTSSKISQDISTQDLTVGVYVFQFQTPDFGKVVRRVVIN